MNSSKHLILASASPRRQALLKEAGFDFTVLVKPVDESYPAQLRRADVALYIAKNKADAYDDEVNLGATVITADTIVCIGENILGKPENENDAAQMLRQLSGKSHEVITAVCIRNNKETLSFYETTSVTFRDLSNDEINFYIRNFKPFDKAGAYGIQEWLGLVAIVKIDGSYHNVVGLPVAALYNRIKSFISIDS